MPHFFSSLFFFLAVTFQISPSHASMAIPTLPSECFKNKNYCSKTSYLYETSTIHTQFFAALSKNDFSTPDEILEKYFDFPAWKTQAYHVIKKMRSSERVFPNRIINDHIYQYVDYDIALPFSTLRVAEVSEYSFLPPVEGSERNVAFKTVSPITFSLKENQQKTTMRTLEASQGIKNKVGHILIQDDPENDQYILCLTADIELYIQLLPKVASEYVEKTISEIAVQLYQLDE